MDLVLIEDEALVIRDYKTRPGEDHTTQATCYFLLAQAAWPGFGRYIFEASYLLSGGSDRVDFAEGDVGYAIATLEPIVAEAMARRPTERANQWCGSCPLRDRCQTYQGQLAVRPDFPADLAALPDDRLVELLVEARRREKLIGSVVGAVEAEMLTRTAGGLAIGPEGDRWTSQEVGNGGAFAYEYPSMPDLAQLLLAHGVAISDVMTIYAPAVARVAKRIEANLMRQQRMEFRAALKAIRVHKTHRELVRVREPQLVEAKAHD